MNAWQKRVVKEKADLDNNIVKLKNFIEGSQDYPDLPSDEHQRLNEQLSVMERYSEILDERIKHFKH